MLNKLYFFIFSLVLISCSTEEKFHFYDIEPQNAKDRTVQYSLVKIDSLNLFETYNVYRPAALTYRNGNLFLLTFADIFLYRFPTDNVRNGSRVEISQGEGPGELNRTSFMGITNDEILLANDGQQRIHRRNHELEFLGEFQVEEQLIQGLYGYKDNIIIREMGMQSDWIFTQYSFDENGLRERLNRFVQIDRNNFHFLHFEGYGDTYGDNFVFGSHYKSNFYAINPTTGEFKFNRYSIDRFETEANFISDGPAMGFNHKSGELSAVGVAVHQGKIYIRAHHNEDVDRRFIDIYDLENGDYKYSVLPEGYPTRIAVSDNYIFTLETYQDQVHLNKYLLQAD